MELVKLKSFVGSKKYKVGALRGVVARRSTIPEEQIEFRYEVYGKFKLGDADPGGYDYVWMTVDQLLECDNVNEEELMQARLVYRDAGEDGWRADCFGVGWWVEGEGAASQMALWTLQMTCGASFAVMLQ